MVCFTRFLSLFVLRASLYRTKVWGRKSYLRVHHTHIAFFALAVLSAFMSLREYVCGNTGIVH